MDQVTQTSARPADVPPLDRRDALQRGPVSGRPLSAFLRLDPVRSSHRIRSHEDDAMTNPHNRTLSKRIVDRLAVDGKDAMFRDCDLPGFGLGVIVAPVDGHKGLA